MMNIFNFFNRGSSTKDVAKSRLQLVLVQDRLNFSSQMMEMLKTDILKVIANYMDIDETEMDIQISRNPGEHGDDSQPMLIANIPVKNLRKVSR